MTIEPCAAHHWTHRALLRQRKSGAGRVDAIVVPASRPAAYLLPAMEVAAGLGCHLHRSLQHPRAGCAALIRRGEHSG